jgi:Zn-finger nucleic acid-binding protein
MARTLNCVCESRTSLLPQELTSGLPALGCETCRGQLLSLDDYRRWLGGCLPGADPDASAPKRPGAVDAFTATATPVRRCPACAQLMERLLSGNSADFRLDRCGPCQLLWMDAGEWDALVFSGAFRKLLDVLSDGGQRGLREAAALQRREAELRARHGDATVDELIRVRAWLAEQPHADILLNLLRSGW